MGKPWELHKLGDFGEVLTCKRIFKDQTTEVGEIPFYKNGTIGLQADSFISRDLFTEFKALYPYPEAGDILISAVGSVGRTAVYKGEDAYFQDSNVVWLSTKGSIDKKYLKTYYEIIDWLIEGSTVKHLYNDNILNSSISVPSFKHEQEKIGVFFEKFNDLISLYERKLDLLKIKKRAYLQRMFPRKGEDIPEFRFEGFTEPWEQRKFGDEMYIKSRVGWQALTKSEYLSEGDYYLITGTDIDETSHTVDLTRSWYVTKERYEMDKNIQVVEGDLIITKDGTIGKVALIKGLDKPATLNSHLFLVRDLSNKVNDKFLFHVLNSWVFQSFIEKVKTGSTLTGLPQKTIVTFEYKIPSIEEQEKVSQLLSSIDDLITLHQRKLDLLKKKKQAYLQNMFPSDGEDEPKWRFEEFTE